MIGLPCRACSGETATPDSFSFSFSCFFFHFCRRDAFLIFLFVFSFSFSQMLNTAPRWQSGNTTVVKAPFLYFVAVAVALAVARGYVCHVQCFCNFNGVTVKSLADAKQVDPNAQKIQQATAKTVQFPSASRLSPPAVFYLNLAGSASTPTAVIVRNAAQIVPVRRWVPDSVSWARLEEAGQVPLTRLLGAPSPAASFSVPPCGTRSRDGRDTHHDEGRRRSEKKDPPTRESGSTGVGEKGKGEPLYLHDWSLPQNLGPDCSLLASTFQVCDISQGRSPGCAHTANERDARGVMLLSISLVRCE